MDIFQGKFIYRMNKRRRFCAVSNFHDNELGAALARTIVAGANKE
jgi:hypothetical protein